MSIEDYLFSFLYSRSNKGIIGFDAKYGLSPYKRRGRGLILGSRFCWSSSILVWRLLLQVLTNLLPQCFFVLGFLTFRRRSSSFPLFFGIGKLDLVFVAWRYNATSLLLLDLFFFLCGCWSLQCQQARILRGGIKERFGKLSCRLFEGRTEWPENSTLNLWHCSSWR